MEHNQPEKPLDGELLPYGALTEKPSDSLEVIQKAMQGDQEAFTALFMQTYRPMYLVVKRYLHRDEDIYDALQNGYVKAYRYLPRLRAPEAFFSWLKKTMENAARDVRSDTMRRESALGDMEEFSEELTVDYAESSERRADIQDVLSRLTPRQSEVLTLHYYDGMKLSEIARLLNEPQSTVRSRLTAAKKTVLALFKEKGIDRTIYGGSVAAILTCALRNAVGSSILSAVVAQDMLENVLAGKHRDSREGTALYRLLEEKRNRAVRRMASLLVTPTAVVCAAAVLIVVFGRPNGRRTPVLPVDGVNSAGVPAASSSGGTTTDSLLSQSAGETTAPGNTRPESSEVPTTSPSPPSAAGVYDRGLFMTEDALAAAFNAAAKDFGDAVKNYTIALDKECHEGSLTLNPAGYTRMYSAFSVARQEMDQFIDGSRIGDDFLGRYSANDEWYFYAVSNGGGCTRVAVNNTTGEIFMQGLPLENTTLTSWQMFVIYKALSGKAAPGYKDISLYPEVFNALPPHLNAGNFVVDLLPTDSDLFQREFSNGFSLSAERDGYAFQKFSYVQSVPIWNDGKQTDTREVHGHILYCAPKARYKAFVFSSPNAKPKKWEKLWTQPDSFAYSPIATGGGSRVPVSILEKKTLSNGWHRFRMQIVESDAYLGTLPFALTFSPYGDYVGFQIEQSIQLPAGNSYDANTALLRRYQTQWDNTHAVWMALLEYRFDYGPFNSTWGEEMDRLKKELSLTPSGNMCLRRTWYSSERGSGFTLEQESENGLYSDKEDYYPLDNSGRFTLTDKLGFYIVQY